MWPKKKRISAYEREVVWDTALPLVGYFLVLVSAAAWAFDAPFANELVAVGSLLLLVVALRNSWAITLAIIGRPPV